ncbi:transposon Tf2-1 polyprotein isoform X1 [Cucumis melo var. makuwa]|uniref:RNA-directed DNA polymerase n=1 Tax=Cucumis melo var. makuwa TaxID=1194695 RepID=A0A5D3BEN4_CUCMM|nr:transposon Tf2-1 polyprotein isoform X1 [Cucumis melo var. makuwa]
MMSLPTLALPNFELPFEIETDASGFGVGAVLIQSKRPIAFYSHTLSMRDRARPIYERELMAVVLSVQRWRPYLLGAKFVVKTDQKSLKFLLEQRVIQPQYQKWLSKLLGYSFEVVYKPGLENKAVGALSRKPPDIQLNSISAPYFVDLQVIKEQVEKDEKLKKVIANLSKEDEAQTSKFTLKNGHLHYKNRLVISKASSLIPVMLNTFHDSVVGGHSGFLRTYKRLATGLLIPLEIPHQVWSDISMDFIDGLPKAKGCDVLLVVVDRLSKYSHFLALKHPYTAKSVAEIFVKEIVRLHRFPTSIVSDQDKVFLSHLWNELFKMAVNVQGNGFCGYLGLNIGIILLIKKALDMSPFQVVYERKPPTLLSYGERRTSNSSVDEQLRERDVALDALREHLLLAQQQMKLYADQKRRHVEFQIDELVLLKIRPYRQTTLQSKRNEKLSSRYFGPYKILERIGEVAYRLELPTDAAIHPVFHISQLRKFVSHQTNVLPTLQNVTEKFEWQSQPEEARNYRQDKLGKWEMLIAWQNLPDYEASWEDYDEINKRYPNLHLEDKVNLKGGRGFGDEEGFTKVTGGRRQALNDHENGRTFECAARKATIATSRLDEEPGSIEYKSRYTTATIPGSSSKMKGVVNNDESKEETKTKVKDDDDKAAERNKFKKVEMPVFTGNDPDSWLFRADRYFQIHKLTDAEKMTVSVISFDGPTLDWFRSQEQRNKFTDWSNLKSKLLERFRSIREGSLYDKIFAIKQTTTVEEYQNLFDRLVAPLSNLSDKNTANEEAKREGSSKRLSDAEFKAKREKGLCFKCDEKYYSGHKCKVPELRELRMFVVHDNNVEEEIIEEEDEEPKELNMFELEGGVNTVVELSINSVVGLTNPRTMKVRGKLQGEEIVVLIDCGATHNFISEKLVKEKKLHTKETTHYGVILGFGTTIKGKGVCENVELLLNEWKVKTDFLPLELGGVDAILGMQWLYSFGLKSMMKGWTETDQGYLVECRAIEGGVVLAEEEKGTEVDVIPATVQNVLDNFSDIFDWPDTLPPRRAIEHPIHLKTGTDPVNVRPYRYVFHRGMEEHIYHLELVFEVLREHKLYANKKKCSFAFQRVEYLGHIVSGQGVEVDPEKIKSIKQWPNYGSIAAPLTQLLKLGAFRWTEDSQTTFDRLKEAMMTLPVLALPDFSLPFEMETDASGYGVGAVLMQNKRPIAFFSHTLALRDRAKPVYERQLMAVVLAVQRWRPYLLGRRFVVKTDQRSLKFLLEQRVIQPQYQKWIAKLLGYSFEILYKPGLENKAADALFQVPSVVQLNQLIVPALIDLKLIREEVDKDDYLKQIIKRITEGGRIWDDISMDFIEGLPKAAGFDVILVVVDRFSKYGHFLTLKHPFDAKTVAEVFVKEVELFRLAGTKLNRRTAYHPQTDGQTEVANRSVEAYLRCFCGERPKEWIKWIHWAEYWYNTTYQRSLGASPFQAVYGRTPPPLVSYGDHSTTNSTLNEQLKQRDIALGALKEHLRVAQDKIKTYADLKRRHVESEEGDMVYLKLRPYRQVSMRKRRNEKLSPKAFGDCQNPQDLAPYMTETHEWLAVPDEAFGYQKNAKGEWEVLMSWKGLPPHEATWEKYDDFQQSFPDYHLEDKVKLEVECNVRPPIIHQYQRRKKDGNKK